MITIKCNKKEKEILEDGFKTNTDAFCSAIDTACCEAAGSCRECVEKNIKWIIVEE